MPGRFGLLVACSLLVAPPAAAQVRPDRPVQQSPPAGIELTSLFPTQAAAGDAPGNAGLSLLLPGLGQHRQGKRRKWLFVAVEGAAWALFAERRVAGGRARDRYRNFAWERARIQAAPRVDGDFDYYETLSNWDRSGGFDIDGTEPGTQPERDATTFNGTIWTRAVGLFMASGQGQPEDPGYAQALDFYEANAYGEAFLWDWSGRPEGRAELGGLITDSDEKFRQATTLVGVVIANHLLSAVDAFLTGRGAASSAPIELAPVWRAGGSTGWSARVSLPIGR